MANIQTSPTVIGTERSTTPATKAAKLTSGQDAVPGRGFMVGADGNYTLTFADDTSTITIPLVAGVLYPFAIKKYTSSGNTAWNVY